MCTKVKIHHNSDSLIVWFLKVNYDSKDTISMSGIRKKQALQ